MRRFLAGVIGLIVGYLMLATCGYWAILMLSSNRFDRSLEAATTAAFVVGPIGAVIGLVLGLLIAKMPKPGGKAPGSR